MSYNEPRNTTGGAGCGGAVLAGLISYSLNHSFWWMVFHFCCGWFYVVYALVARTHEIVPALRAFFGA